MEVRVRARVKGPGLGPGSGFKARARTQGPGLGKPIEAAYVVVEGTQLVLAAWLAGEALHVHVHGVCMASTWHHMACEGPAYPLGAQVRVRVGATCMSLAPILSILTG